MKPSLVYALMLLAAGNLYGQIGQTEEAASAAFGKPLGSPHNSGLFKIVAYRTTAYEITAAYKDGKTAYLIYKKSGFGGQDWTLDEVTKVLNANLPGGKGGWKKVSGKTNTEFHRFGTPPETKMDGVQSWQLNADKNVQAEFHPESKAVVIWDSAGGLDAGAILGQNAM